MALSIIFLEGTKAKLQKKNTETGNWDELPVEVPIGGGTLFEKDERTIDVTNYGPGTYRFVYDDGCDVVNVTKEVEVEGPKNLDIKSGSTLRAWCDYGIHGNTAGATISVSEKPMQYGVHIERKDGAKSTTFKTTPFLSDVEYEHTLSFPIDFKTTPRNGYLQIYDLPVGEYVIRISRCGEISSPMSLTIGESDVIKYQPRDDSGYKNGVKVQAGCGDNTVSFDFGLGDCNHLSQDYYKSNSPALHIIHLEVLRKTHRLKLALIFLIGNLPLVSMRRQTIMYILPSSKRMFLNIMVQLLV